jgi:hypothetical protein
MTLANKSVEVVCAVGGSGKIPRWDEDEVRTSDVGSRQRLPRVERGAEEECRESDKAHVHGPNTWHAKEKQARENHNKRGAIPPSPKKEQNRNNSNNDNV